MLKTAVLLLFLAGAGAASYLAWQEHLQLEGQSLPLHRLALLESENAELRDALAAAQRATAAADNASRRVKIEQDVASIRELPFRTPVVYDVLSRAAIKGVIQHKLSEQYTDQEMQDIGTGMAALGLLPSNFPLKQTYIDLLGEQVAAFYDQHQHRLFMFEDASLAGAQNRIILAHELTHALQDQNFGLTKLPLEGKTNDDRSEAASALIEGDATLVMAQYMAKDLSWQTLTDTVSTSLTQNMEQIRKAPRYLREMLVFPYLKGQQFCAAIFAQGGFPALSAVYAHPPSSTAQILHPEKYLAEPREEPIPVVFADTTLNGAKPLDDNVLGEMGTRLLFEQALDTETAEAAAAGWRGDRYLVFEGGHAFLWKTVWRSEEATKAALAAFDRLSKARFKEFVKLQRGAANEVVFIHATTKESADRLAEKFALPSHG